MGSTYASAGHSRCLRKQLCARVDAYPFCGSTFGGSDFVSILAEIKTAGFSGGGLIAVIAGGLLLGSGWYGGNVAWFEFLLYFGGIALILLDIFVLVSGFGVAAGILSMTAGLYFTFGGDMTALWVLSAAMILAIIGIYFLADHLSENRMWKNYLLHYLYLPPKDMFLLFRI